MRAGPLFRFFGGYRELLLRLTILFLSLTGKSSGITRRKETKHMMNLVERKKDYWIDGVTVKRLRKIMSEEGRFFCWRNSKIVYILPSKTILLSRKQAH